MRFRIYRVWGLGFGVFAFWVVRVSMSSNIVFVGYMGGPYDGNCHTYSYSPSISYIGDIAGFVISG